MQNIDRLRNELSRVASDIYLCNNPEERERLIKKADEIVKLADDAMIFYQWRHSGTA